MMNAIFDLDGTLLDTPKWIVEAMKYTLIALESPVPSEDTIRMTIGQPLATAFSAMMGLEKTDTRVDKAVEIYQSYWREHILKQGEELLFPGVKNGLKKLKEQGWTLSIATNKFHRSAIAVLEACEILDYFQIVLGADQVTQPKPHPESAFRILTELQISSSHAVMIGDTTHDLKMANGAGMRSIAVTYGIHSYQILENENPTWIVNSFTEVVHTLLTEAK